MYDPKTTRPETRDQAFRAFRDGSGWLVEHAAELRTLELQKFVVLLSLARGVAVDLCRERGFEPGLRVDKLADGDLKQWTTGRAPANSAFDGQTRRLKLDLAELERAIAMDKGHADGGDAWRWYTPGERG